MSNRTELIVAIARHNVAFKLQNYQVGYLCYLPQKDPKNYVGRMTAAGAYEPDPKFVGNSLAQAAGLLDLKRKAYGHDDLDSKLFHITQQQVYDSYEYKPGISQRDFFKEVKIGEVFCHLGNAWLKCTRQTALLQLPLGLAGKSTYMDKNDIVSRLKENYF